jgi:Uncharacterized protein conserved in bacteria
MNWFKRICFVCLTALLFAGLTACGAQSAGRSDTHSKATQKASVTTTKKTESTRIDAKTAKVTSDLWTKPSDGPFPILKKGENVWIDVSIGKQRVQIKSSNKVLYTMPASTGMNTPATRTPTGTFHIQNDRGLWFFTQQYHVGAKYWVSWKGNGQFLFHSVPMDKNGKVIVSEAKKLGTERSHGCIRLPIPDAKWIYDTIPVGTKVVVHQ